jgi:Electron transfer DM13
MTGNKKSLVVVFGAMLALGILAAYVHQTYAPKVLATGRFHQVAHKGEGVAAIVQLRNGRRLLRLTDFHTADKPDLSVMLVSAPDAFENQTILNSKVFVLGQLQNPAGDQEYELPADLDLASFGAITIWNRKYAVNFTTAPLRLSDH